MGLRTGRISRTAECWNFASRTAAGTLSAAVAGPGVLGSLVHLGGAPTDIGIHDNTAASGGITTGGFPLYISGASAGQTYTLRIPYQLGLAVYVSGTSRIGVTFVYD